MTNYAYVNKPVEKKNIDFQIDCDKDLVESCYYVDNLYTSSENKQDKIVIKIDDNNSIEMNENNFFITPENYYLPDQESNCFQISKIYRFNNQLNEKNEEQKILLQSCDNVNSILKESFKLFINF